MGLGTFIDYKTPVMDNDCRFNVKKENDYDDNGTSKHVHITPKSSTSLVDAHSPSTNISQSTETPNIFPNGSYVKTEDFLKSGTELNGSSLASQQGQQNLVHKKEMTLEDHNLLTDFSYYDSVASTSSNNEANINDKSSTDYSGYNKSTVISSQSVTNGNHLINKNHYNLVDNLLTANDSNAQFTSGEFAVEKVPPLSPSSAIVPNFPCRQMKIDLYHPFKDICEPLQDSVRVGSKIEHFSYQQRKISSTISSSDVEHRPTTDDQLCLPSEQTINKALALLQRPSTILPKAEQKSAVHSKSHISSYTSPSKKEVTKRRTMQERLDRLRDCGVLEVDITKLEKANTTQLAMLMRRFKKQMPIRKYLSDELIQHIFEKETCDHFGKTGAEIAGGIISSATSLALNDPNDSEATEMSTDDDEDEFFLPSTSSVSKSTLASKHPNASMRMSKSLTTFRFHQERVQMGTLDTRLALAIDECSDQIECINSQLTELRNRKQSLCAKSESADVNCARCIPINSHLRRKLIKVSSILWNNASDDAVATSTSAMDRMKAYSNIDHHLHPHFSLPSMIPVERRIELYVKRRSNRPCRYLRKRLDLPPWISSPSDLNNNESKKNIGSTKVDEKRKRKLENLDEDDCVSDMQDEEYLPWKIARRNKYKRQSSPLKRAHQKLIRRSLDQKRHHEQKLHRRARLVAGKIKDFKQQTFTGVDLDDALPGLPQKIDYKEISIPRFCYKPLNISIISVDSPCTHLAHSSTPIEIAKRHLSLELEERKRFQQYRDYMASKVDQSTDSKTSSLQLKQPNKNVPTGSVLIDSREDSTSANLSLRVNLDDSLIAGDYDRLSVVEPYSPRSYSNIVYGDEHMDDE